MQDALNRRSRFSPPQPRHKKFITLSERDLKIFDAIARHGKLPSKYIAALANAGDLNCFKDRLTILYNGFHDRRGKFISYLGRDRAQFDTYFARNNHLVYHLTPHAQALLEGSQPRRYDDFVHQLFGACFSASFEALASPNLFIDKREIFARVSNGSLTLPTLLGHFTPDDLFGVRYPDGKVRFFVVEIDRNTESIRSHVKSSIAHKVKCYEEIFTHQAYRDYWKIPNLSVLIATTGATHANNMAAFVSGSPYGHKFLFKAFDMFGENWRVPRTLLDVYAPWLGTKGLVDISKRATD